MLSYTGLPHEQDIRKSQEKLRKMTKVRKKVFEKHQILSAQIYKIPYIYKPSIDKKLIKAPFKPD